MVPTTEVIKRLTRDTKFGAVSILTIIYLLYTQDVPLKQKIPHMFLVFIS